MAKNPNVLMYSRIDGVEKFSIATEIKLSGGNYQLTKDGSLVKVK